MTIELEEILARRLDEEMNKEMPPFVGVIITCRTCDDDMSPENRILDSPEVVTETSMKGLGEKIAAVVKKHSGYHSWWISTPCKPIVKAFTTNGSPDLKSWKPFQLNGNGHHSLERENK